jgi:hypothetical protein
MCECLTMGRRMGLECGEFPVLHQYPEPKGGGWRVSGCGGRSWPGTWRRGSGWSRRNWPGCSG